MLSDGLIDPYSNKHMGEFADLCASKYSISRQEQDEFAKQSYLNSLNAQKDGLFTYEISPIKTKNRGKTTLIFKDEEPDKFQEKKITKLKPAFSKQGTVTAFNASKLSDGAAGIVVSDINFCQDLSNHRYFEVIGTDMFSGPPSCFTTAPTQSIKRILNKSNLKISDIGLFEINEAFSVVPLHAIKTLGIRKDKVNIYGGAISLGHPLGCSGSRILVTLMNSMSKNNVEIGCASICLGGGEALSILIKQII